MQVFEKINTVLSKQIPFVCYVKPNESVWNLLVQQNDEIIDFSVKPDLYLCLFMKEIKW
jgi:isochorismate synthase